MWFISTCVVELSLMGMEVMPFWFNISFCTVYQFTLCNNPIGLLLT